MRNRCHAVKGSAPAKGSIKRKGMSFSFDSGTDLSSDMQHKRDLRDGLGARQGAVDGDSAENLALRHGNYVLIPIPPQY